MKLMGFNFRSIILMMVLVANGCSSPGPNRPIPAGKLISDYQLKKTDHWVSDNGLTLTTYENNTTGAYLLVALNQKQDTILNYFGDCARCFRNFYRFEREYILEINNAYKISGYFGDNPLLAADQYFIDSVKYFKVDTVSLKLTPIVRQSNDSMINRIKAIYHLAGDFTMVHPPLSKGLTISKDTLINKEVYYEVATNYQLKKQAGEITLGAEFSSYSPPHNMGIFINKETFNDYYIGCNASPMNFASFCLYLRTYSKFVDTLRHYGLHGITRNELIIKDNDHREIRSICSIPEGETFALKTQKEIDCNDGVIRDLRIDMFRCYGDYFVTTFLPHEDECMEGYPPVFHLDTSTWVLRPVLALNAKADKIIKNRRPLNLQIFSYNERNRASDFMRAFKIIQVANGYRIARKN